MHTVCPSALPTTSQTAQSTQAIASRSVFLSRLVWVSANRRSQIRSPSRMLSPRTCGASSSWITATACFRQILNLLKTWEDMFGKFVQEQETEIRDKVRRLTELDDPA